MPDEKIILGIDPGTNLLGFGVIRALGRKAEYVDMGILDIRKEKDAYAKIHAIWEFTGESPFYAKNAQVLFKLGRAQGAAITAAVEAGLEVYEYAPRKAKEAIVGNGAASKEQVGMMLEKTLGVTLKAEHLDATDALAIAMCHFYEMTSPLAGKSGGKGWAQFLKDHPERIK